MTKTRTAVLISGRGSNLKALIDACTDPLFPAELSMVISNIAAAPGMRLAEAAGIPARVIPHTDFDTREEFDAALDEALSVAHVKIVCLAGFMRILTSRFVNDWAGRLINIHPSILPSFKGAHVHERAIEAGVRLSGCTVHFVTPEMDSGPAIAQAALPVYPDDDASSLAARVLAVEHTLYPIALRMMAEGRVRLENGRAVFHDIPATDAVLISPQFPSR